MLKKTLFLLFTAFLFLGVKNGVDNSKDIKFPAPPTFECKGDCETWVNSTFDSLSLDQKIGQLFVIDAYSKGRYLDDLQPEIESLIRDYHVGGVAFFKGNPVKQAQYTNRYQALAKTPLMIVMDMEWGLGMRLDSTISFPRQMTLGAIDDDESIYKMGAEIARQSKRLGIHVNFAPVVDINVNRLNPVIGRRSFGSDREQVAKKSIAYMKGLQHNGIMACAKHFPGHGDTGTDSHLTLPIIEHNKKRLDSLELYPFKRLMSDSLMSVMIAHLYIPVYDSTENQATTLSSKVINGLLRDSLGFKGLVFSDGLDMQGVTMHYELGEVSVRALLAGNDILLKPKDGKIAIESIKEAIQVGLIPMSLVNQKVRKILEAKYFMGLNKPQKVKLENLLDDLNHGDALALKFKLYEEAVTVLKNDSSFLPIREPRNIKSYAAINFGDSVGNTFQNVLGRYAYIENFAIETDLMEDKTALKDTLKILYETLKDKEVVFLSFYNLNVKDDELSEDNPERHGLTTELIEFVRKLDENTKLLVTGFSNLYAMHYFEETSHLICAYERDSLVQTIVPQIIFGALGSKGKLPADVSEKLPLGTGIATDSLGTMQFGIPESVGLDGKILAKIDAIIETAITGEATPGCQLIVAKDGKIVKIGSYGFHSYEQKVRVSDQSMYDIASITKIAASLQVAMQLEEQGKIDLDKKIGKYLPSLKGSNKEKIILKEVLTHQAGLTPYIPYWQKYSANKKLDSTYFSYTKTEKYPIQVTPKLFSVENIDSLMWNITKDSDLRTSKNGNGKYGYKYSDLTFYIMHRIIDKFINLPMEDYVAQKIYKPLGLPTMTYRPLEHFPKSKITPTEMDTDFRLSLIHGTVHDPGAALKGGVAGHAGIFSNAMDLAVLMQMNLQGGKYKDKVFFQQKTLEKFNTRPYAKTRNRRGIGWDKPVLGKHGGPTSNLCSAETFGHTGFTGTCAWADPENGIVYIFLSNRVYPYANNWKLVRTNVRTDIQDLIYKAIIE